MNLMADILINVIIAFLAESLLLGLHRKIMARVQKRPGPPVIQYLLHSLKFFFKETSIPKTVSKDPTSALDPEGAATVRRIVAELSGEGRTVVMVDHDPDAVAAWADLLLVLEEGELAYFGAPGPFLDDERRVTAAGIRPRHLHRGGVPERPGPRTPPVLEAIDLTHRYPSGVLALDGVGVTIHRGEFVALLGGNGTGKTTLAKHFAGLLEPTSGTAISCAAPGLVRTTISKSS